jgi:hypothetical protein
MTEPVDNQQLIARLNSETAKIAWHELQKHYALGNVLAVAEDGDLIQVAIALHRDDTDQVQQWLGDKSVSEVSDQQALAWYECNATVWALVIPPFILVQAVGQ